MGGFGINFLLKQPEKIVPFGRERDHLSWFGLTDGDLWITAGERTIYEYSDAAMREWGEKNGRYNDYYLSRFLEDFSETFEYIRESVPRKLYDIIDSFAPSADAWLQGYPDDDDEVFDSFFDGEYLPLTEWFYSRIFDSGHLTGGPHIGCFRCGDMIKLYWHSGYLLENGESIWTAPSGIFELPYSEFTAEIKRFFGEFYEKMNRQTELSLAIDWGNVRLDKEYLIKENEERKIGFDQKIALLSVPCERTDWDRVGVLYEKMRRDLSGSVI